MSKRVYKFSHDCGRMGFVEGMGVLTETQFFRYLGAEFWLDEPFGKHSEYNGKFSDKYVTQIGNEEFAKDFEKHIKSTGHWGEIIDSIKCHLEEQQEVRSAEEVEA